MRLIVQIYEEYVYSPKKIRYGLLKIGFLHFSMVFLLKKSTLFQGDFGVKFTFFQGIFG